MIDEITALKGSHISPTQETLDLASAGTYSVPRAKTDVTSSFRDFVICRPHTCIRRISLGL
jgi:hypothetical protein